MREVKFRAWNSEEKRWDYFTLAELIAGYALEIIRQSRLGFFVYSNWCQHTDLHDKNGKEIYEGDILDVVVLGGIERYAVKWVGTGFFLMDGWGPWSPSPQQCEVIGNIYENPELLKQ